MGLINLQTNLKSLKFGNDRVHGGSSNQPYIISSIPEGDTSLLPNEDFILRGGLYSVKNTTEDVLRLTKYFNDPRNPNGLLFTAKQNLLSRTAVRTQVNNEPLNEGIYTPLSTLAQASVSAFGLHFNKQGFNPIPGTPGSLRTYSDNINSIIEINDNRLTSLTDFKIENPPTISPNPLKTGISPLSVNILTYTGGPGSILGIGNTNIKFATDRFGSPLRTGANNSQLKNSGFFTDTLGTNYSVFNINNTNTNRSNISLNGNKLLGVSDAYSNVFLIDGVINNGFTFPEGQQTAEKIYGPQDKNQTLSTNYIPEIVNSNNTFTYTQEDLTSLKKSNEKPSDSKDPSLIGSSIIYGTVGIGDFRAYLRRTSEVAKNVLPISPDYTEKNIEQRVNLGDPGNATGKNLISYTSGSFKGAASVNSYDKINRSPIILTDGLDSNTSFNGDKNDLVKFAISVLDTKQNNVKHLHFRAFLNQISDGYSADWSSTQYIGRGEKFYTYSGFDRKVSLSWTVAAQSKAELIPMYKKLNYLASVCAPNYSENGYMQGNIVKLTIGGYFFQQPGIITGFSYEMNDDSSTWEIGINDEGGYDSTVKELPHLIKVSGFNFIPIHTFVPRLVQNPNTGTKERYIALQAGTSNYDVADE